jgi:hypothetical protein
MTTREEYAEAAAHLEDCGTDDDGVDELFMLAARVLRQLAEGAVLCKAVIRKPEQGCDFEEYIPLDWQPWSEPIAKNAQTQIQVQQIIAEREEQP